jgi:hypothetical protein
MSDEQCRICLDNLRDGTEVYETKCHHKFHKGCLVDYCNNLHGEQYVNFSSINCPLCKTALNCRIDNGEDMFPEIIHKDNPVKPIVAQALDIIDPGEYEIIDSVDDIVIDLNLTPEEKEEVFQEILKRKNMKGGRRRRTAKRRTAKRRTSKRRTSKRTSRRRYSRRRYSRK